MSKCKNRMRDRITEFRFFKVNNVQDFWSWILEDFLPNMKVDQELYNSSIRKTYTTMDSYLNDTSSILIGYPILRQLRTANSISLSFF
jgi:hypothetical protein